LLRKNYRVVEALVRDISAGGLGLLLTEPVKVGEQVSCSALMVSR
jgi:hypothetical protein